MEFSSSSRSSSSSVYNNPKLTKPRSSRGRVALTGENFIKLQKEMAAPRPTGGLRSLPDHALFDLMTCIRCGAIPHPQNYKVCEDRGHHLCGSCAHGLTLESSETALALNEKKFYSAKVLEACCASRNLKKGSPLLLQALWDRAMWRCPNQGNGCAEEFLGTEWDKHLEGCKFKSLMVDPSKLRCYFRECTSAVDTIEQLLEHYTKRHGGAPPEVAEGEEIEFRVDFTAMLAKRHVSLFRLKDPESLLIFAYEPCKETEILHIWVWNMGPPSKSDEAVGGSGVGRGRGTRVDIGDRPQSKDQDQLIYNLKIIQIRDYDGVKRSELTFEEACLPHNLTPEEIMRKKGTVKHFKIELQKLFQGCVEGTPDGRGKWRASLKFESKKGKGQGWESN